VILDTCALLFLASGDRRLTRATRDRLSTAPLRWFCAISSFEIALKSRDGKLKLPEAADVWMKEIAKRYVLTELPIDSALCFAAAALPLHHRDPFDRFIVAGARRLNCPVVTVDATFALYDVDVVA
jgi:PIN domain nuclease of toxin-antitoxin system